jgi:type IV pilus assembly protein PilA
MRRRFRLMAIVIGALVMLVLAAAIVLPTLFRARMSDGGPPGARHVRTLATSEITYSSTYPEQGYAPNLAVLGPDRPDAERIGCRPSTAHACLIDPNLGCSNGTGLAWCADRVYRYNIQSSSLAPPYKDYWITATPLEAAPERKNYCMTSDAVLRSESGPPLSRPYTLAECEKLQIDFSAYRPD